MLDRQPLAWNAHYSYVVNQLCRPVSKSVAFTMFMHKKNVEEKLLLVKENCRHAPLSRSQCFVCARNWLQTPFYLSLHFPQTPSLSISVCLSLLTTLEHLNPVWKQLAFSDLINRGPGQQARGNISGPGSAIINLKPLIQWLKYEELTCRTMQVLWCCSVPTCYISPRVSVSVCLCANSWMCIWLVWFISEPSVVKWVWHLI